MSDKKISQLTGASTPLAGTEVLPIVQSGSTVKVATDDLTVKNIRSNSGTGILQITGPSAGTTRGMTVPNADFTVARADASQTFTGAQTFTNGVVLNADSTMNLPSIGGSNSINVPFPSSSNAKSQLVFTGTSDYRATFKVKLNKDQADNAPVDVMQWGPGVDVTLSAGNLVIGTAAKGIDFSANTGAAGMTSELLDWYEEGTFTPTLQGSTGNPTPTYTAQVGTYTRIGNVVYVWIQVYTSAVSGGSGDLRIGDLPFNTNSSYAARFVVTCTRIDFGASATYVNGAVDGNSNKIYLSESNDNSNDTVVSLTAWNTGAAAGVSISGFYFV